MKITGSYTLHGSQQQVWDALQDPGVLVRTLPGCRRLEEIGPQEYTATVDAGVASIKGTYDGRVAITDADPPHAYTLKASGAGGPGTIDATARVTLQAEAEGVTRVAYDADAVVGGTIAGVGQRVLAGAARRNAAEFFAAVERVLSGDMEPRPEEAPPKVFERPAAVPAPAGGPQLFAAIVAGALAALAGVAVGRWSSRRR